MDTSRSEWNELVSVFWKKNNSGNDFPSLSFVVAWCTNQTYEVQLHTCDILYFTKFVGYTPPSWPVFNNLGLHFLLHLSLYFVNFFDIFKELTFVLTVLLFFSTHHSIHFYPNINLFPLFFFVCLTCRSDLNKCLFHCRCLCFKML